MLRKINVDGQERRREEGVGERGGDRGGGGGEGRGEVRTA